MLDRIVSLALIVCFLPLPGANSVVAWEFMNFVSEDSVTESEGSVDSESTYTSHGRVLHHPLTFDPEILVFCEVENEVRENESKDGEDDSIGISVLCRASSRKRIEVQALRLGIADPFRNVDNIFSRYHVLRC